MGFWYLSSPYTRYHGGIQAAFEAICREAALLVKAGISVYSPIAHTHVIAMHGDIDPLSHAIWMPIDKPLMEAADGIIVCELDGWDVSYGVGLEIEAFKAMGKKIVHMTPGIVPEGLGDVD